MAQVAAVLEQLGAPRAANSASPVLARTAVADEQALGPASYTPRPSTLGQAAGQRQTTAPRPLLQATLLGLVVAGATLSGTALVGRLIHADPPPPAPAAAPARPVRVRWVVHTTPPGAEVLRHGDDARLGLTPFASEQPAAEGELVLRLRLAGHADRVIRLDRGASEERSETLSPLPKTNVEIPHKEPRRRKEPAYDVKMVH